MPGFSGADRFFLMLDRELRARGLEGCQSTLGVDLEGPLEPEKLGRCLAELVAEQREMRFRLGRLAWLGPWIWKDGPEEPEILRLDTEVASGSLADACTRELSVPLRPGRDPLLQLRLQPLAGERWRVLLRWFHAWTDERGAELILRELDRRYRGEVGSALPTRVPGSGLPAAFSERRALFHRAKTRLSEIPPLSPCPFSMPLARSCRPDRPPWLSWSHEFSEAESQALEQHWHRACGLRGEGLGQIGLTLHAVAVAFPELELVATPVSLQLRPARARGPLFGNALSFLFYAAPGDVARREPELSRHLAEETRRQVLAGADRETLALLDMGRWLPLPLYRREMRGPGGRPQYSVYASTVGELFGGIDDLFGCRIERTLALTAFPPPGIGAIWSRSGGRLAVTTVFSPWLVPEQEAERVHETLRRRALELASAGGDR